MRRGIDTRIFVLGLAFVAGLGLAVTCQAPPDPDAEPAGAMPLALETWHRDALDCTRRVGDCADWFAFATPGPGSLRIDLAKMADEQETPEFSLVVGDASGALALEEANAGRTRLLLRYPADEGRYSDGGRHTLAVRTPEEGDGAFAYELRVSFVPKPLPRRPPAPRFEAVRAALLEVETGPDGGEAVLIDKGSRAGIARGQKGRLLQDGKKIADIEILDVYPDGSRAAIRGALGAALTPATVAEVDVPL